MNKESELPKRRHTRLKKYDYSSAGAYFVTICTKNRKCVFSHIAEREQGYAEAAETEHTAYGRIAENQLLLLKKRYPFLSIDKYVIMPDHIHAIIVLSDETAGASPRPTIADIICAYKSLTTRECKNSGFKGILFQDSFYEHIIRGCEDYEETVKYIHENPIRWYSKHSI